MYKYSESFVDLVDGTPVQSVDATQRKSTRGSAEETRAFKRTFRQSLNGGQCSIDGCHRTEHIHLHHANETDPEQRARTKHEVKRWAAHMYKSTNPHVVAVQQLNLSRCIPLCAHHHKSAHDTYSGRKRRKKNSSSDTDTLYTHTSKKNTYTDTQKKYTNTHTLTEACLSGLDGILPTN